MRVAVAASGVCHSDLSIITGAIPSQRPVVLGHEGSGTVVEVGSEVRDVAPGDHVVLTWVTACRRCYFCVHGRPELCVHGVDRAFGPPYATGAAGAVFCGFGTATFGAETIVSDQSVVVIPSEFPMESAALIGCAVMTGVGAVLNRAHVEPGSSVAVIGCGGVGLAAIQAVRLSGASRIIAVDVVSQKLAMAEANGATHVIDASSGDPVAVSKQLTGGRGADYTFEVVGRSSTIAQAYAMARRGGTVTVVGAGRFDDMVSFGAMQMMVEGKTIHGSVYGDSDPRRDVPKLIDLASRGRLDLDLLVSRRFAIDEINEAFRAMEQGEVARGMVVYR